jgi:hypothetical protein
VDFTAKEKKKNFLHILVGEFCSGFQSTWVPNNSNCMQNLQHVGATRAQVQVQGGPQDFIDCITGRRWEPSQGSAVTSDWLNKVTEGQSWSFQDHGSKTWGSDTRLLYNSRCQKRGTHVRFVSDCLEHKYNIDCFFVRTLKPVQRTGPVVWFTTFIGLIDRCVYWHSNI